MHATGFVYKTKILLLAMSILLTLPVHADEAQCKAILHDCDTALHRVQDTNQLQAQIIKDQDERFKITSSELSTARIWKPLFLGAGVVIGVETLVLILKR